MRRNQALHTLAASAIIFLLLPTTASAMRRTALVIGNAAYEAGPLRNPVHDASDMATTLRQLGVEVTLLRDVDRRTMVEAIDRLSRQLRQGGVGLFYFAGHGVQVSGENYLLPLGARISREQDVPYEGVPVGRVLGGMEDADNQLNIIILDACRDNPFARQWRSSQRGLAVMQAARGSLIAYATAPGGTAIDGDGRNGLYTFYLLQHLTTPGLSVEHVFKKVREGVVQATKGKQTPWESSSLIGDFSFTAQAAAHPEAVMWALIEKSSDPEAIATFLQAYPNGKFAPAARLKLQQLQQLAAQQRLEEQHRLAEQERQRREREGAEAQRLVEERQRLEAAQHLRDQSQETAPSAGAPQLAPEAGLGPESTLPPRAVVAVPAATVTGPSSRVVQISAFQMDRSPVSNGEFLAFVRAYPQWKKSHIAKDLHDGDYLKHWAHDETLPPNEIDLPVRYISYYAALAYCQTFEKTLPGIGNFRAAARHNTYERHLSITYEEPYKAPEFKFVKAEWTRGGFSIPYGSSTNPDGVLVFSFRSQHSAETPLLAKHYTGSSLGFRCSKRKD